MQTVGFPMGRLICTCIHVYDLGPLTWNNGCILRTCVAEVLNHHDIYPLYPLLYRNKNAAEVDIAPASGKIIKNVRYRSRSLGQDVRLKGTSRTITMQGFTFAASLCVEKIKLRRIINKANGP